MDGLIRIKREFDWAVSYLCGCSETGGCIADSGRFLGLGAWPQGGQDDDDDEHQQDDEQQNGQNEETA